MTPAYRFSLLFASMMVAGVLSACQPSPDDTETTTAVSPQPVDLPPLESSEEVTEQVDPDMALVVDDTVTDDEQVTDMLKDYNRAMSKMHDEMMIGMGYNNPDTAFAKSMLGHHRGAIDMAKLELKYGTDIAMQQFAQTVIEEQQAEIDILKKWLASHPDTVKPNPNAAAMQQAFADNMQAMHGEMMVGVTDPVPDMAFARGMLPHHIGAVDMARAQLQYGDDEEMRQLAQQIIDSQLTEIQQLQNWLATYAPEDESLQTDDDAQTDANAETDAEDAENTNTEAKDTEQKDTETSAKPAA